MASNVVKKMQSNILSLKGDGEVNIQNQSNRALQTSVVGTEFIRSLASSFFILAFAHFSVLSETVFGDVFFTEGGARRSGGAGI